MAKLSTKKRNKMKGSTFCLPKQRKYPVPDKSHARNALARVSQHGTAAQKKTVRACVYKKYPSLKKSRTSKATSKKRANGGTKRKR